MIGRIGEHPTRFDAIASNIAVFSLSRLPDSDRGVSSAILGQSEIEYQRVNVTTVTDKESDRESKSDTYRERER